MPDTSCFITKYWSGYRFAMVMERAFACAYSIRVSFNVFAVERSLRGVLAMWMMY